MAMTEDKKQLPNKKDYERLIVGYIMEEPDLMETAIDFINPKMFYDEICRKVYESILLLYNHNEGIDIYTVTEHLNKRKMLDYVGGAYEIARLIENVGSSVNFKRYCMILAQTHYRVEAIKLIDSDLANLWNEAVDIDETFEHIQKGLLKITEGINGGNNTFSMAQIMPNVMKNIEDASQNESGISGVPTGFNVLDNVTQGWQKSDLIIIGGRPAMGKTALCVSLAVNEAKLGNKILILSLEMSKEQIGTRILSMESGVNQSILRSGRLTNDDWNSTESVLQNISNMGIYIDDEGGINETQLRSKIKKAQKDYNIDVVIVDYLQLIRANNSNQPKVNQIGDISATLKNIAKETKLPIICLSQLSREAAKKQGNDNKPTLTDLRDSGNIEQDADIVLFIHRPEYYGIPVTAEGEPTEGLGQLIIGKNRAGVCCDLNLKWEPERVRFTEWT